MGGRLSVPQSPDKMSELSKPTGRPRYPTINFRTLTAPLAAVTMATLLFFYARTSIQAAKLNARKHAEADGGQLSWHKQNLRSHGVIDKVESDRSNLQEALLADLSTKKAKVKKELALPDASDQVQRYSEEELELRRILGKDLENKRSQS